MKNWNSYNQKDDPLRDLIKHKQRIIEDKPDFSLDPEIQKKLDNLASIWKDAHSENGVKRENDRA